jgi:hypothetical protein
MSKFLMHCGIILTSALFALMLGEVTLRALDISYPVFDDFDESRGVRLRPGKQGWYRAEGEAYLQINSLGYRDREHDRVKPADTVRIAVLGDSFVEARQVALEDTFWHRLGGELEACHAFGDRPIEMLSFGTGGYNTSQEYLTLQEHALDFNPDIVLLVVFAGNDIEGNWRSPEESAGWRMPAPTHKIVDGKLVIDSSFDRSPWRRLLYASVHASRLMELINEARRRIRIIEWRSSKGEETEAGLGTAVFQRTHSQEWEQAWLVTEALLAEMNNVVRARGAEFLVATVPAAPEVTPDRARRQEIEKHLGLDDFFYPDERIAGMGAKWGFPVFGLTRELQEIAERERMYMHGFKNTKLGFGHLNEQGHEAVAKLLATKMGPSKDGVKLVTDLSDPLQRGGD